MNYKLILKLIGNTLRIEALFMLAPLIVSLIYGGGDHRAFLWSIPVLAVAGSLLGLLKPREKKFRTKDAYAAAALSWLFLSLFGALPFIFSGCFESVVDCLFESISGFTTTGATIFAEVESLPKGILFWRSFSHWIGGMGVLVFMLAVMPSMGASSVHLLQAESTGPSPDKIVPKIRQSARIMYLIYLAMTVVLIVLLIAAKLPVYDALINAFSVAGTGGFSNMNASAGAYGNLAAEIIMTIFMFLFGINFTLYFILLGRDFKAFLKNQELRVYLGIVIAAIAVITVNISKMYGGVPQALRLASFQVTSIISSTGFSVADINLWPTLSQVLLLFLMVTGCCAGSTGGGIKLARILLLIKAAKIELGKIFHPGNVKSVTVNGKKIDRDIVSRTALFFFAFFAIFFVSTALVSIEGKDIISSVTAVIASLSNAGPGLGIIGPAGNFSSFSPFSKIVFSFCMLAGRLELFPVLVLFRPAMWKRA